MGHNIGHMLTVYFKNQNECKNNFDEQDTNILRNDRISIIDFFLLPRAPVSLSKVLSLILTLFLKFLIFYSF